MTRMRSIEEFYKQIQGKNYKIKFDADEILKCWMHVRPDIWNKND